MADVSWQYTAGGTISYSGSVTINSVTRTSATLITIKYTASITTVGGDNATWMCYYKPYKLTENITDFQWHAANSTSSKTFTHTLPVATTATSASVTFQLGMEDISGNQAWSKQFSKTVTVPSWTTYKITYNANGGSNAPSAQTKYKGVNITLSTQYPTKSGCSFQGWGTSSTATAVSYAAGATYSKDAAITLYAIWKSDETYYIYYNANGGTMNYWYGASIANIVNHGNQSTPVIPATCCIKKVTSTYNKYNLHAKQVFEYPQINWNTKADGSGTSYTGGEIISNSSSINLYAIYSTTPKTNQCILWGDIPEYQSDKKYDSLTLTNNSSYSISGGDTCIAYLGNNSITSITNATYNYNDSSYSENDVIKYYAYCKDNDIWLNNQKVYVKNSDGTFSPCQNVYIKDSSGNWINILNT